jgi:hypothetical protein
MFGQQTFQVLSLTVGLLCLAMAAPASGSMKIQLKDGSVITVPVNKDDIVSMTFEDSPRSAAGETLVIPNDKPVKVKSQMVLEKGRWYVIEASGVISDWSHVKEGVDAVWCYAEWRCGKQGEVWSQLRIDEKGMPDIASKPIPYNPQHIYQVRYQGQGRPVELYASDAQGSWSDNSGSFTVKISSE